MKQENAERLVDLVYSVSTKKGAPSWPLVPVLIDGPDLFAAPIPAGADPRVLGSGFAVLSSVTTADGMGVIGDRLMSRSRISTPPEARLLMRHVPPGTTMITFDIVMARSLKSVVIGSFVAARLEDGSAITVKKTPHGCATEKSPEFSRMLYVDPGVKVMASASWTAQLGVFDGAPSILLPTDAEGIYALFRDRASGGGRKKALLHWVREHVRALADRDVTVRPHLRGVHKFEWHSTAVKIAPPVDSIEAAELGSKPAPSVLAAVERYRVLCSEQSAKIETAESVDRP